jgi:hypothetical protein
VTPAGFDTPAFHRAIAIMPRAGEVTVLVEDDLHRMRVVLGHDGDVITRVDAKMIRAP